MKVYNYLLITCVILLISIINSCKMDHQAKFDIDTTIPWCIVAFDSLNRTPEQRIQLLNEFGFKKYAYDWRDHHLHDMEKEISLAKENWPLFFRSSC